MSSKAQPATEGEKTPLARRIRRATAQVAKQAKRPKPQEVTPEMTTTPAMREIGGSAFGVWNEALLHRTCLTASRLVPGDVDPADANTRNASIAGLGLRAFRPSDPVEAMIAAQATGLHFATMECLRLATANTQYPDVASKLRKDAANLSRAMVETTEALQRRKGKGPQTIRVERVVVQDGGQAVVGNVTAATPPAIGQGPAPMPMVEVAPVALAAQGEGEQ